MASGAYYNEIDPDAVAVLQELIRRGVIAPGDVDSRSIKNVQSHEIRRYTQHHFFAGGGVFGPSQLDWLDGPTTGELPALPAHASRGQTSALARVPMIQGICGRTYFELSETRRPQDGGFLSLWENRLADRLAMVGSTESALIWQRKVTPAGRSISRLAPSTLRSNGTDCSGLRYWVAPSARDWKDSLNMATEGPEKRPEAPKFWPDRRKRTDQLPRQMIACGRGGLVPDGSTVVLTANSAAPNPAFACWLMGIPRAWLSGALQAMRLIPFSAPK